MLDGGAYASFGLITTYYAGQLLCAPYEMPAYRFDSTRVYTNKPACGPKRGHGSVQPRFAFEVQIDKLTEKETLKLGFTTTSKSKPLIIDELRASVREGTIELNDKVTIREMLTYIVTQSGGMEAEAGCFDDCVMSLALANHIHEGAWEPITSVDAYYIEMV